MITTIYKCDKCGTEQTSPRQMWNVGVVASSIEYPTQEPRFKQLWCRKCCDAWHMISIPEPKKDEVVPQITFEDRIREIIKEVIDENKSTS